MFISRESSCLPVEGSQESREGLAPVWRNDLWPFCPTDALLLLEALYLDAILIWGSIRGVDGHWGLHFSEGDWSPSWLSTGGWLPLSLPPQREREREREIGQESQNWRMKDGRLPCAECWFRSAHPSLSQWGPRTQHHFRCFAMYKFVQEVREDLIFAQQGSVQNCILHQGCTIWDNRRWFWHARMKYDLLNVS